MCSSTFPIELKALVVTERSQQPPTSDGKPSILHICKREILRPLRDQILRLSGYRVDSCVTDAEAHALAVNHPYDVVLIDVEGERGVAEAEQLCSDIKTSRKDQLVAFVCNWRVALLTDCPDEIVRTEFDPAAFVSGVREIVAKH